MLLAKRIDFRDVDVELIGYFNYDYVNGVVTVSVIVEDGLPGGIVDEGQVPKCSKCSNSLHGYILSDSYGTIDIICNDCIRGYLSSKVIVNPHPKRDDFVDSARYMYEPRPESKKLGSIGKSLQVEGIIRRISHVAPRRSDNADTDMIVCYVNDDRLVWFETRKNLLVGMPIKVSGIVRKYQMFRGMNETFLYDNPEIRDANDNLIASMEIHPAFIQEIRDKVGHRQ